MKGTVTNWVLYALSIFPLMGLLLLGLGLRNVWWGVASNKWPQTRGVVVGSEVSESTTRNVREGTTSTMYSSSVRVSYRVNGQEYMTNKLHFGQSEGSSDPSEVELAHLSYPQGMEVAVSYDPQKPALATLKPGFFAEALTLPAYGVA